MSRHGIHAPRNRPALRPLYGLAAGLALLAPGRLAAQQPQSHTVVHGNTLWSLSQQYLGDPLLWPELYRLNTDVVEDPHWIYPGEVLRLAPGAGISAVPGQDTPVTLPDDSAAGRTLAELSAPNPEDDPRQAGGIFPMMGSFSSPRETIRAYSEENYRAVRRGEFYRAGFLTEDQRLPFGRVVARTAPMQIRSAANNGHSKFMGELQLSPPDGAKYEVGDSLLVVRRAGRAGDFGEAIVPTGMVVVSRFDDDRAIGRVVRAYDMITPGQWLLPLEKFPAQPNHRAEPITQGVEAMVIGWPGHGDLTEPQRYLYLDKGRTEGVSLGDIFELHTPSGGYYHDGTAQTDVKLATAQVVHVGEHTATAIVTGVVFSSVRPGTAARQVAKLPG